MSHRTPAPRIPACPSWCQEEPGHEEQHEWGINDSASLLLDEDAPVTQPPTLSLWIGGNEAGRGFTAADARRIAAELLNAADEMDKVTNGGDRWTEDDL